MRKIKFLSVFILLAAIMLSANPSVGMAQEPGGQGDVPLVLPICPADPGPYRDSGSPPIPLQPGTGNKGVACRAIPTGVRTVPPNHGPLEPSGVGILGAGYHHMGAQTSQDNLAIYGRIFVSDPATRSGTNDSVFARFLEKSGSDWIEVGWVEGGGGDQCVYAFDSKSGGHDFCQYDLIPGQGYYFLLIYAGGSPPRWRAYLYWNGWVELLTESVGFGYADWVEEVVEIYTGDGFHFNVPRTDVGPPVQIYESGSYHDWTPTYPTSEYNWNNPYHVHWEAKYYDWYVHTH
jgi:hypothetical protein